MISHKFRHVHAPSHSVGHWLPRDRSHIQAWLSKQLEQLDKQKRQRGDWRVTGLDPTLVDLQELVDNNPTLRKLARDMFTQIPPAYVNDPTGKPQVRDFGTMLELVNQILQTGPEWFNRTDPPTAMGLIGFPINAILDWPMGTLAGYTFFLDVQVNEKWHAILTRWKDFLQSEASQACLDESTGWLSADALQILSAKGDDGTSDFTFQQLYICNPDQPYFDFSSWDSFFTRRFRPGVRPVAFPDDQPPDVMSGSTDPRQVVVNACESIPLQWVEGVKLRDTFWLKGQPYSLADMLDNDPRAAQFVGGAVYQAFLSALSYHRWHAPVSGTVLDTRIVPGTYYSENLYQGFIDNNPHPDPAAANNSQPYISAVATRGIIFIQADDPDIGLMAIVFIGMAEVSSCEFTVGKRITKGQEIGMFHFGGSSHCMLFRPSTKLKFVNPPPWPENANNNPVNSALALVLKQPEDDN
ncbi:hypothetical protein PVAG01_00342 [Phlyctema vagabunda]|uniref:L-tryptophan decarboxylase PsiD-like domain-containing protein n=1 Tax=Phlyctema vagabunda TaxID=108571 RepID=A0ABR4PUF4_9HELO